MRVGGHGVIIASRPALVILGRAGPRRSAHGALGSGPPTDELETITAMSSAAQPPTRVATILLYASDRLTRENVRLALGRRVARDLAVSVVEVATQAAAVTAMDAGGVDLAILDGEAVPGGMGLCRQLKDEVFGCPPALVLTARRDDAWLATWSRADGVLSHPVDPLRLPEVVAGLLRDAAAGADTARPA